MRYNESATTQTFDGGGYGKMDAAMNLYEQFEPRTDCYFFRIGSHGQICCHGRNYTIKKRMSREQVEALMRDATFVRVSSDCYVNVTKITYMSGDAVFFGDGPSLNHMLPVPKRKQHMIRQSLSQLQGLRISV